MKKIIIILRNQSRIRIVGIVCAALLIIVGAVWYYQYMQRIYANQSEQYASYLTVAKVYEQTAYVPGSSENPVRQELNKILSQVLAKKMTDAERLALAHKGKTLLKESEQQINAIGEASIADDAAIEKMEHAAHVSYGFSTGGNRMTEIISLARKRSAIIADIRGLSYRANYETQKIFDRIIADKGALTKAHILALNDQIPEVEKQYNERSNLYVELQDTSSLIEQKFVDMGGIFSVYNSRSAN